MPEHNILSDSLGTIGTFLWCVQLVPQIWHNYRKKNTDGLPASMMLIWAASSIPFGVYAFIKDFAIPLQVQPQMFAFLAIITWSQILYYDRSFSVFRALVAVIGVCILIGGCEVFLIYGSELLEGREITWHKTVLAVFAAVMFVAGYFPAFLEIHSRKGRVAGISFGFIVIDCFGALFSLAALFFQREFDYQGGMLYLVVIIIEIGITTSHGLWLYRTRHLHQKAKALGVDFDELPEAAPYQGLVKGSNRSEEEPALIVNQQRPGYGTILNE